MIGWHSLCCCWLWYSCPGIQLPNWSVLQTKRYHCGTTSTCAKAAILFDMVFTSIHTAVRLQSVLLSETHHWVDSVWNQIHLRNRSNLICHGIHVHSSSCPWVSSSQRVTTVEPYPPAQKGQFYLPWYSCSFIQLCCWSVLQSETRHCGITSTCTKAAILFDNSCPGIQLPNWSVLQTKRFHCGTTATCEKRQFYLLVFLSGQQPSWSVLQLENHHCGTTSTCANGAILFAAVFLSGLIAAQLECTPDKEVPLWNHIHLRKSGDFICHGFLSIHPAVRLQSVLLSETHHCGFSVESHPPAQKKSFICWVFFVWASSCPVGVFPVRDSPLKPYQPTQEEILFAVVFLSMASSCPVTECPRGRYSPPEVGERSDWSIFRYRFDLPILSDDTIGWCQVPIFVSADCVGSF